MSWLGDHWTRAFDPLNFTGLDTTNKRGRQSRADAYRGSIPRAADPKYNAVFDPNTMNMSPELKAKLDAIQLDKTGLNKFRNEATRDGASAWNLLAKKNQRTEALDARERGLSDIAGQTAGARSMLAMRGGATAGSKERLARHGARDALDMTQNVSRQKMLNSGQIDINDEQNRVQQLGMLPGMEIAALQPDLQKTEMWGKGKQFDLTNQINEGRAKNDWEMEQYKAKMAEWAAAQQAGATMESGGKK